ncbi:MAG: deoxyribodipyrimidine photo-lyase [Verrucomicrobia bacterium]|nr:deoxyribodipyrimidine photo-lyase [Verrucomicrobiota bacterium]MDA0722903.1 deoxyribodipyrimidine photo-lyase [Verrucomicrobiota bacterium]MDA1047663.1 deoxyribodipyrimidine photo-lyase [Verrucomicrobiota bacterium]
MSTEKSPSRKSRAIVWFRKDLRVKDNPALVAAYNAKKEIVPVFIWNEKEGGQWSPGAASRWWLHQSLIDLGKSIDSNNGKLILRKGIAEYILPLIAKVVGADTVFFNRSYDPAGRQTEISVKDALSRNGIQCESFNGSLLNEPWEIKNGSGKPYQIFTPYWKLSRSGIHKKPTCYEPSKFTFSKDNSPTESLHELGLLTEHPWHEKLHSHWIVSEDEGHKMISRTTQEVTRHYSHRRNIPSINGTSRLSPYLAWGNISPRQICQAVLHSHSNDDPTSTDGNQFLAEIGWREFSYHLLYHFPHLPENPLRPKYAEFPWRKDAQALSNWQLGKTGYPLVDAGMRQLYETGWMHNRVRMVVASFLVKHLLMSWTEGTKWFWDTLVDADLASNTQGWQWAAGCGADAAPYFRIFNPILQGEKFDTSGKYARRWIEPLKELPSKWLFKPWEAPTIVLSQSNVTLGQNYPQPCVDHPQARARALEALATLPKN